MLVTDETKAVAQRTFDYLNSNPDKHNQQYWVGNNGGTAWISRNEDGNLTIPMLNEENFCNTTLCAAGAVVFLEQGLEGVNEILFDDESADFDDVAASYLGLDSIEAYSLFYDTGNEGALNALLALAQGDEEKFSTAVGA